MTTPPLTPQEREVANALPSGRPKRNLHVFALIGIGTFFLLMAAYKGITRFDSGNRVAERSGPKATAQEPSAATLKEMIDKQSVGAATPKAGGAVESRDAVAAALPPQAVVPAAPIEPRGAFATPGRAAERGSAPTAPSMPVELGRNLGGQPYPPEGGERPSDLERRLAEASYMTAKTDIYVQSASPGGQLGLAKSGDSDPADLAAAVTRQLQGLAKSPAGGDALANILDPKQLGRLGSRQSAEDRISARTREQESFASASSRAVKEPIRSSEVPQYPFVAEGSLIPAVIVRAVATNLPGQIEARVTSDVYDSVGRGRVLIPKGSRITGQYNANVAIGQERVQVAFTRIIFPSGASIALENSSAADLAGNTGMPGEVNNHFVRIFGSALAIGLLTYGVERRIARDAASQTSGNAVNIYSGQGGTPGTVAAQTFANVSNQILDRNLVIGPTITVPAGTRINVHVARDLAIDPRRVL